MQEKRLIAACRKRDRKAQFLLYDRNKVYLFGICQRYAKSRDEAQDMLQEGFYLILRDLHQYSGKVPLKAWMRRVMINSALMHLRKFGKLQYSDLEDEVLEKKIGTDVSLFYGDRAQAVIALIQELPVMHQTVFNLRALDGYTFKEIANQTGIKESTLRSHYLRARTQLQNMLKVELAKDG